MEGLMPHNINLKDLRHKAERLTSTCLSLITLLAKEANRISREDEALRLKALYSSIIHRLYLAEEREDSAKYGQSKADIVSYLGALALGGVVKQVLKNKRLSSFANHLLESPIDDERPFGNVLVCIGPRELPDDVRVVSISQLARESNRQETEVIYELRERGCLLFGEKKFSILIDKLATDVREGRLRLPISNETLSKIIASNKSKLRVKKAE